MIALSIRQPWAYCILDYGKDIENRTWSTSIRGRVLIHASKGMSRKEYEEAKHAIHAICYGKDNSVFSKSLSRHCIMSCKQRFVTAAPEPTFARTSMEMKVVVSPAMAEGLLPI